MDDTALRELDKEVRRLKRIASEWAGQLHDLVEDRLPAAYAEIPGISNSTYEACQAWADANARLLAAQQDARPTETP
ncbi:MULTISPECIES: CCE_0567 family metalloprotein [Uliginosibacterium]|uniref:Rop-like protein n=1 Tax=Uliginosibacterium aquaticum TaxID=2731212 RepID=A0ABX2IKT0_9RHOO|nr:MULTISPECIES: CCE_0567 family metalloprotein [Uliginosibacterium]MDO6386790.1 CCE_0567 family metalloprotein [Uliginosibacterium sp. 31-12]NSL54690.1 hypothetical protein [Uliginosibacterium aquaticum]PLK48227.1 hypothetical protein C0V76_13435 [Uliginosibacterium sp. TH139]